MVCLVVPPKSPADLAKALKLLIEDQSLRDMLAQQAREITLTRYTAESINTQILGFYKKENGRSA